ncbi:hypothetical protein [Xanthocytophaga agilis]|uniref:Uncharacterized protein n=1 Tax=Xanthocytophaga agilis TaxID=3048010 RepID=A0AAE3RDG7_9BACT|nr:hypothetical protein [Xanthocytophaga agilis]MDJ1505718.1 hypothetical protein [Xanthocytophaga agilis]
MRHSEEYLTPQQVERILYKEDIKLALRNYLTYLLEYKQLPREENSLELIRKQFFLENRVDVAKTLFSTTLMTHHSLHLQNVHGEDSQEQHADQKLISTLENLSVSNLERLLSMVDNMEEVNR